MFIWYSYFFFVYFVLVMNNPNNLRILKTSFTGGGIAFALTVLVISLSFVIGPVYSASLNAFPFTILMFAISASLSKDDILVQKTFDKYLVSSVVLYFVTALVVLIWWIISRYVFHRSTWSRKTWISFTCAIVTWFVTVIVLLIIYNTKSSWRDFFSTEYNDTT